MLFHTPDLTEAELSVSRRVEEVKTSLGYAVRSSPNRWQGLLRRSTFARAIQGSNSIEGYNVTLDDAIAAAEGEEPLEADAEAWTAVRGYREAMTYVLQLADDPHFAYSTDLLRGLHFMMMQHDLTKHPGRWRPGTIFVRDDARNEVVYEGPEAERVAPLMRELIESLNAGPPTTSIVRAAMAHLNLVMIHPFSDGNGRMARCLQTLVLARTGTLAPVFSSIEEYLGRNTQAYYDVLARVGAGGWHPERDARPWVRFCLTAHFRQATTLLRRSQVSNRLWDEIEAKVKRLGLPDRTILAVADAATGFRVRNATYRRVADVTEGIASRDLKLLVDHDFLVPLGEKRGRYYVGSESVRAMFIRLSGPPRSIPDPFDTSENDPPFLPGLEGAIE